MDKRKNNGGHKTAGRKPKSQEEELIKKLSPLESKAFKALEDGLNKKQNWAVKLFFEYKFGKAREYKEVDIFGSDITITIGK